jgi:radical SAM superfamily enzyme YgiQ (UPF0313 family)
MYSGTRFRVRPLEELVEDLDAALATYGPGIRTIFLADGNCAALSTRRLVAIGGAASKRFPALERITVYGSARFLAAKSRQEWREIAKAGITRVHSGLESGDPETLAELHKGVTPEQAVEGFRHLMASGIELSVYLMVGVAGLERWQAHADGSAAVLDQAPPTFVRLRTFVPIPGTAWHRRWQEGRLTLLDAHQAVAETRRLVAALDGPTRLVSDHISNFINVEGRLPDDRAALLARLDEAATWPLEAFRPPTEQLVGLGL